MDVQGRRKEQWVEDKRRLDRERAREAAETGDESVTARASGAA